MQLAFDKYMTLWNFKLKQIIWEKIIKKKSKYGIISMLIPLSMIGPEIGFFN